MKKFLLIAIISLNVIMTYSQEEQVMITQMTWGPDYQVYMKMSNDSSYIMQIAELFHANPEEIFSRHTEFLYYPVNFERSYIDSLLAHGMDTTTDYTTANQVKEPQLRKETLWSSLKSLGGGWVHFTNCLMYALETRQLELTAPLLTRPHSNWKPNPVTESWKRTHKWKYYVPVEQRYAIKEYKKRRKYNQLGDLNSVPKEYIKSFLSTSQSEYDELKAKKDYKTLAKIDLVKLMLGNAYMGQVQISYIKSRVLQAVTNYNAYHKPTVLIFDKYQAAVAMTMNETGYKAEKIIFKDQDQLYFEEIQQRTVIINGIIALINEANKKAFQEMLGTHFK
jgi:hypothetical protein